MADKERKLNSLKDSDGKIDIEEFIDNYTRVVTKMLDAATPLVGIAAVSMEKAQTMELPTASMDMSALQGSLAASAADAAARAEAQAREAGAMSASSDFMRQAQSAAASASSAAADGMAQAQQAAESMADDQARSSSSGQAFTN